MVQSKMQLKMNTDATEENHLLFSSLKKRSKAFINLVVFKIAQKKVDQLSKAILTAKS